LKRLKMDLHCHTWYSHDSILKPNDLVEACLRKGINCIAVTDHNEVDGAKAVARIAPFKVIIGEEIRTRDGEISGLFLKERIPPHLSAVDTVREIKRQKGMVYVPHPFAAGVTMRLHQGVLEALADADKVDIVEGWNSRGLLRSDDLRAQAWALAHGIPFAAGSDSHTRFEIGSCYVELDDFKTPKQMVKNLKRGILTGRKTNLLYPAASVAFGRAKVLAGHRTEASRQKRSMRVDINTVWTDF
jgi:predicted metal-dependent phosphoesterase TrpH